MTNGNGATAPLLEKMNGNNHEVASRPYKVLVSMKFVVMSLLASMLLAFAVGKAARHVLLGGPRNHSHLVRSDDYAFPSLTIKEGKMLPKTRYTSKNFDTSMSASSSSWLNTDRDANHRVVGDARECHAKENGNEHCSKEEEEEEEDDDDEHPSGEHLMVDIKHVSMAFLNSEQRLAQAMVDLVQEADLTLLSYHCHGLTPAGVSCVGVLLQNYVSFHTWPVEGVITFDLCVGGNIPILPLLPSIKRLFGVPRALPITQEPEMRWAFMLRGFREPNSYTSVLSSTDLAVSVLLELGTVMKRQVSEYWDASVVMSHSSDGL